MIYVAYGLVEFLEAHPLRYAISSLRGSQKWNINEWVW